MNLYNINKGKVNECSKRISLWKLFIGKKKNN